jgi:formylmethanofuran dehydrogenase subunit B
MDKAWIDGAAVSLDAAAAAAADVLKKARMTAIAGLGTDVAGTRAAILLADRLNSAIDHMRSGVTFRDLDVLRQAGTMITTPGETRLRADVIVFVGAKLATAWPQLMEQVQPEQPAKFEIPEPQKRRLIWIGASKGEAPAGTLEIAATPATLPTVIGSLRALVKGRKTTQTAATVKKLTEAAEILKTAHFGVAIWSGQTIDTLSIEMLTGLIVDLNDHTRFSSLPLVPPMNAAGVALTSNWMTGFPVRTGFGRGFPEHDTWRFDSTRLIDSGEADSAIWISAYAPEAPPWTADVPLIALTAPGTKFAQEPHVRFEVGTPGIDYDGVQHVPAANTLVAIAATQASDAASVASILGLIDAELAKGE